jgi:hypothetical protein
MAQITRRLTTTDVALALSHAPRISPPKRRFITASPALAVIEKSAPKIPNKRHANIRRSIPKPGIMSST